MKNISGHYYVYERSRMKDEKGRWHTKSGAVIGTIKPGAGFIPREGRATDTDVTCVDYGQYATVIANSQEVLALLDKHFNKEDAIRIYACAIIHFVEGFCHMKGMKKIYDQSWLSLRWPFLKMGDRSLSSFYEVLGYRQTGVLSFEQALCDSGSGKLAIDGHVIGSCSWWNGLSQKGYRFNELKEMQMNMIMAYDVVHKMPVAVKVCEGGENDKLSVKELFELDRSFLQQVRALCQEGTQDGSQMSDRLVRIHLLEDQIQAHLKGMSSAEQTYDRQLLPINRKLVSELEQINAYLRSRPQLLGTAYSQAAVEVLDNLEDAILRVQRSYTARELEPFLQTDASFRTFGRLQDSLYFNTLAVNCMQTLQEMHELADQPPT